jgi:N-acetylmuramoyl-L-alanine amidase
MRVVISSGHGKIVRGAAGPEPWGLDEVDEARRVVQEVAIILRSLGVAVVTYHDNVSTTQNENLNRIVDHHNEQERDLDVSVHFNAYETTAKPMGTECLYLTQQELAADVALAIADAGDFLDRGGKKRSDLYFLNHTEMPAILIEVCFVDSQSDAALYDQHFEAICDAIARCVAGSSEPGDV